jgi:TonB family protein
MNRSVLISLALHLAVIAGVVWATEREGRIVGPPERAYMVNLVSPLGPRGGLGPLGQKGGKPSQTIPRTDVIREKTRTGLKVEQAPSNDPFAPKGAKKPARTSKQKPGEEGSSKGRGGKGAPGGGGLRLEGDQPFPFPEYLQEIWGRIQDHWEEPLLVGNRGTLKATVFFKIFKDGTVAECSVVSQSGMFPFDNAALKAVLDADSMPPLPEKFQGDHLGVYLDFEY